MTTCLPATLSTPLSASGFVLQIQSVRETNRLLDGRMQQLQSQLQDSAANNKQARVCCHIHKLSVVLVCTLLLLSSQASCIGDDATMTATNVNDSMQESVMELTRERGDLDMKRMHAENELRQCQHTRQSLELEKDILQRDVTALQTQLDDRSEGLRQSWKDANAKASVTWSEHESTICLSQPPFHPT